MRRSALPSPGDERELGILVSRLHGHPIDFHRPPWEVHLIEGLEGGRFALYVKVHHSLVDGYTRDARSSSTRCRRDPDERDAAAVLLVAAAASARRSDDEPTGLHFPELLAAVREQYGATKSVGQALLQRGARARIDDELVSPLQAPKCILNARISRSRRFATQQLDDRAAAGGREGGGRHAQRRDPRAVGGEPAPLPARASTRCPTEPLIAMLPVSVRAKDDAGGGNAVGAILASLATDSTIRASGSTTIIASTTTRQAAAAGHVEGGDPPVQRAADRAVACCR